MANLKQSYIYAVQGKLTRLVKIGVSVCPKSRLQTLQTGSPDWLSLIASWPGSRQDEKRIHQQFRVDRSHGEWFRGSRSLLKFIAEHNQSSGTNIQSRILPTRGLIPRGWKASRERPGWQIKRIKGYDISENVYGVTYLKVLRRKPRKITNADFCKHPHAGFFPWKALEISGRLLTVGSPVVSQNKIIGN